MTLVKLTLKDKDTLVEIRCEEPAISEDRAITGDDIKQFTAWSETYRAALGGLCPRTLCSTNCPM